ncbi:protachykinin-1 isoform X1 [Dicentrarchus labrax]|uniref:Tachykinin domain-containing protein n=1 Tax=Dicentrarchus labrax TaxID=13489 RepID=A0A8P4GBL5_DICLA|nr:protachykinin-1 isoform X1 [Dicentrarchus labrax]
MKLLLLPVLMAFFAVAQVFCEEIDPKEDADYWTSSNQIQDGWLSNDPFREILLRMTRKPRPHQFIGLMGKRSTANAQITHKRRMGTLTTANPGPSVLLRHKVNSFVGLMGKRSQEEPESYEWSTIQTYDKRR